MSLFLSILKVFFIIVFNFVMASTAKCISERRARLSQQWIPSVLTLAAQPSPPQLYGVTGAPAGSNSDKHHLCFISVFLSFWITFCLKTRIFSSPWSLLEPLIFFWIKDSSEPWCCVKSKLEWPSGWVFPGWIRFNNYKNFIYRMYTWWEKQFKTRPRY